MKYIVGNLLESDAQALVNTVNTVGVMGKGIALQFKERFPYNFKIYADACKRKEVQIGRMLVVKENTFQGEKIIINFPTKTEWFKKSEYGFIEKGLNDLIRVIQDYEIKSIAVPPLGSGNGGLKWENVKSLIQSYLGSLKGVDVLIYEPDLAVKDILRKESQRRTVELKPGRAMLLYALFQYEKRGEMASVFAANKLAYFLQKTGEPLRLNFVPYLYGPYAQAVEKVLYALNGKYLTGMEQMTAKPFEPLKLNWERYDEVENYIKSHLTSDQMQRLKDLFIVIEGFESTLSLEILASVHYLLSEAPGLSEKELLEKIQSWNDRKKSLITAEYIQIANQHLLNYGSHLSNQNLYR